MRQEEVMTLSGQVGMSTDRLPSRLCDVELNQLSDVELNRKLKSLAGDERNLLQHILEHIAEVDRRKLYLKSYPSLFDYLTKEIGYSAGSAQRRIDGARLLQKIPEVAEDIRSGDLQLTQISKMTQAIRQVRKETERRVDVNLQKEILEEMRSKTLVQTELVLSQKLDLKIERQEKRSLQKDESTRIEITFSKDEIKLIKSAQALLSHKTGGTLKGTLVELAKRALSWEMPKKVVSQQKSISVSTMEETACAPALTPTVEVKTRIAVATGTTESVPTGGYAKTAAVEPNLPVHRVNKTVTPRVKKEILWRDQSCQYRDKETDKLCGYRFFLDIDHIKPRYLNGPHTLENLRVYCHNHNLYRYKMGI